MSLSRLVRNVFSNYVWFAISGLTGFFLTPILLHALRPGNYAIYIFSSGVLGIVQLLGLGLISTLVRVVSDLVAREEYAELSRLVSIAFYLLLVLGTIGAITLAIFSHLITRFFGITGSAAAPAYLVVALLSLDLINNPGLALSAYLEGCQDFHLANAIHATTIVLRAVLMVLLLKAGFGLLAIAAVVPLAGALWLVGLLFMARRCSIPFTPRLKEVNLNSLKQQWNFASLAFFENGAARCFYALDTFLAAKMLPLPNLAILAVARR